MELRELFKIFCKIISEEKIDKINFDLYLKFLVS